MGLAKYSQQQLIGDQRTKRGLSKGSYLRVHYKNTLETAALLNGMQLQKAFKILNDVQEHKACVPFRRHNGGIGRTAQGKQWKATQGRWPVKSVKFLRGLLKNAEANAVANELSPEDLVIRNIVVQQAPKTRRRTYRAHGRINPYQGHPCHIEIILAPIGEEVPKAKDEMMEIETEGRRQTRGEIEA